MHACTPACTPHLDDGGQHALREVQAQRAVDVWQLLGVGAREHADADVHGLQVLAAGHALDRDRLGAHVVHDGPLKPGHHEVHALLVNVLLDAQQPVEHHGAVAALHGEERVGGAVHHGTAHQRHARQARQVCNGCSHVLRVHAAHGRSSSAAGWLAGRGRAVVCGGALLLQPPCWLINAGRRGCCSREERCGRGRAPHAHHTRHLTGLEAGRGDAMAAPP